MIRCPCFPVSCVRFVYLTVPRDLFEGAVLVLECGRIDSAGRLVRRRFADEGQAVTAGLCGRHEVEGRP